LVLTASLPVAAGQDNAATQEKPASKISTAQRVTCDALLQHPLAWWLGSMPTPAERDQLAACLAGSGQQAPASPSVHPAPSAAVQDKPANWNRMNASEQAQWLHDPCQSLVGSGYYTCKHPNEVQPAAQSVSPATQANQMYPSNWNRLSADQQATWNRLTSKSWAEMTSTEQAEWTNVLSVGRSLSVAASTGVAQYTPGARWTPDTCDSERQSLSLLSERINQTVAQLQALAALPQPGPTAKASPTYRCNSDSLGSQTTTTCRPDAGYVSPGAAFSNALEDSLAKREAARRFDALAARVQTQQNQFDTRFREWESHCTKR